MCECRPRDIDDPQPIETLHVSPHLSKTQDCQANAKFSDCEKLPVREWDSQIKRSAKPPQQDEPKMSDSVDSQDVVMIDTIRGMALEEQFLNDELKQLGEKEKSYEKAMQLCNTLFASQANTISSSPESPEVKTVKAINQKLSNKSQLLNDKLSDARLELKQLRERIDGPLKRELERTRRKCLECQCKFGEVNGLDIGGKTNELSLLKEQLESACNNISDIHAINAELRQEVLVLNYKCNKLQEMLIKNKMSEINTIKKLNAECTC